MFIYQNGNLYIQEGNTLVGVEIYPDKTIRLDGEKTTVSKSALYLTLDEVKKKFPQESGGCPTFKTKRVEEVVVEPVVEEVIPEVVKEVKHDTTRTVSKSTRGSSRKR